MIYGLILAAGIGTRMGMNCPKALIKVKNKPIFVYPLEVFKKNKQISKIIIACHPNYIDKYKKCLKNIANIDFIEGDLKGRQESLKKAINYISKKYKPSKDDIIVTHDCARINLTQSILNDAINCTRKNGYCTVAIKANDSLYAIDKNKYFDRKNVYLIQTPQCFKFKYWKNKPASNSTDLFTYLNLKLTNKNFVCGSIDNYKITEKNDLVLFNKVN